MPRYYFPNYWPLFLLVISIYRKSQGSHVELKAGRVRALGLPQKHTVRAAAHSKGAEIRGRERETESWSSHFPGITQEKRWVRHSGHGPDRCLLSPP